MEQLEHPATPVLGCAVNKPGKITVAFIHVVYNYDDD